MDLKLEIKKYLNNDVIVTSGHYATSGMSPDSYQLCAINVCDYEICDWGLIGTSASPSSTTFNYYDENGTVIETDLYNNGWVTFPGDGSDQSLGKWFHYNDQGEFILCNDPAHHNKPY